jgi:hypothetical protein
MPAARKRLLSATEQRQRLYEAELDGGKADLEERLQSLYRQNMKDEASRKQQLLGAFAAGGLGFLALCVLGMAVARIAGGSRGRDRSTRQRYLIAEADGATSSSELE